jgi:cell division protein FtsB
MPSRRHKKRPPRAALVRRWLAVGALTLVAYLYYHPLVTYLETRREVAERVAEVRTLEQKNSTLERSIAVQTSNAALVREARRVFYVKPGERLFIVKGIAEWRRAQARKASTIGGDG